MKIEVKRLKVAFLDGSGTLIDYDSTREEEKCLVCPHAIAGRVEECEGCDGEKWRTSQRQALDRMEGEVEKYIASILEWGAGKARK